MEPIISAHHLLTCVATHPHTPSTLTHTQIIKQDLADKKKEITNLDLESIVNDEMRLEMDAVRCCFVLSFDFVLY